MDTSKELAAFSVEMDADRLKILDKFGKAFLAGVIPDSLAHTPWLVDHIELVEHTSPDGLIKRWFFRLRKHEG